MDGPFDEFFLSDPASVGAVFGVESGGLALDGYYDDGVWMAETGWDPISATVSGIATIGDIASGGPQKRERAAKAEQKAAEAYAAAELAKLEAAKLAASTPPPAAPLPVVRPSPSPMAALSAPSLFGLPRWAVGLGAVAGVGAIVWAAKAPRKKRRRREG